MSFVSGRTDSAHRNGKRNATLCPHPPTPTLITRDPPPKPNRRHRPLLLIGEIRPVPVVEDGFPAVGAAVVAVARDGGKPFQDAAHAEDVPAVEADGHFWVRAAEEGLGADCAVGVVFELGGVEEVGSGEEFV